MLFTLHEITNVNINYRFQSSSQPSAISLKSPEIVLFLRFLLIYKTNKTSEIESGRDNIVTLLCSSPGWDNVHVPARAADDKRHQKQALRNF